MEVPRYSVESLRSPEGLSKVVDDFDQWGFVILEQRLSPAMVERYRSCVERLGQDDDPGWEQSHSDKVLSDVLASDHSFRDLVDDPCVLAVVGRLIGPNIYAYMSEAISRCGASGTQDEDIKQVGARNPNGIGLYYHRDSDGIERDLALEVAPRMSVKAGYFLTDATETGRGNTWVVPGSHSVSRPAELDSAKEGGIPVLARAGDVMIFDRRLWHSGTPNESKNTRVALFVGYAHRWLRPRFDTLLPTDISNESPVRQQLLGAGTTKGRYEAPDVEVPLRAMLAENAFPRHSHD